MTGTGRRRRSRPSGAFSVLELVVAMTLGIVLMSAIWTMFSIFAKRQEVDRIQTETSQLIRGLHQLLSRDVSNIVPQDAALLARNSKHNELSTNLPAVTLPIQFDASTFGLGEPESPKFGSLVGSASEVQLLVFDDGSESTSTQETKPKDKGFFFYRPAKIDWPFRTVVYRFESGHTSKATPGKALTSLANSEYEARRSGLIRRETFFGSRNLNSAATARSDSRTKSESAARFDANTMAQPLQTMTKSDEQVISEETVSEFSEGSFEYFDGVDWRDSWDSREAGTLPFALRVRFNLKIEKQQARKLISKDAERSALDVGDSANQRGKNRRRDHEFILAVARDARPKANLPAREINSDIPDQ